MPREVQRQHRSSHGASRAPGTHQYDKENHVTAAVNDLMHDPTITLSTASQRHGGIPITTLEGRLQGRKSRIEAHEAQKVMDKVQEDELAEFLREMDGWGLHLRLDMIKERAQNIVAASGSTHVLGVHWVGNFIHRYPDLKSALSQRKDILRAEAEKDPIRLDHFFTNLKRALDTYNIQPHNLYNIDEKGFLLGVPWRSHVVIVRRPDWPRHSQRPTAPQSPNREIITVIDCICADGTVLPPFLVMKGQRPTYGWVKDSELEEHSFIAASPNGWTDNELGKSWLEGLFDPQTRPKAAGAWRCIVLDNHESHISFDFIKYAWSNQIIIVSLEPHTSGRFQPLDVGCFKEYQLAYGMAADDEIRGGNSISKQDFPRILPIARRKTFTRTNIVRGFELTGIWPFNPDRFDFIADYHSQQQQQAEHPNSAAVPEHQSTAVKRRTAVLSELQNMLNSPPPTPSRPLALAKKLGEEVMRGQVREELYSSRIKELRRTEKGRNKQPDRRKPPGASRVFEISELNRLREERDERDRGKRATRGRGRGGGRTRSAGGSISRARGAHSTSMTSRQAHTVEDDADYIPNFASAKPPLIRDEDDMAESLDSGSSTPFSFIPATWN